MRPALLLVLPLLAGVAHAQTVLGLDQALQLAVQHQPTLLQAQASSDAAEGRREQQRSVLLPQLSANALYQRQHGNARVLTGGGASGNVSVTTNPTTTNVFSVGLQATQVLWDFGAIERFRAAGFTLDAQRATERATRLQLDQQVRSTFFLARAQQALVEVAEQTLANQLKHQAQVEGFVKVGLRPEIDLAQAQTAVANAQVAAVKARNAAALARAQLRQAIGGYPGPFSVGADELAALDDEDAALEVLTERAIAHRPELSALLAQQDASALSVRAAQAGYLPTVGASAGVSDTGTAIDALQPNWQFGLTLSWNLFQGGLTVGQTREQRANADLVDAQLAAERLAVGLQVEQAQLLLQGGKSSLQAAIAAEASAGLQLRLAEGRYTQGVGSIIELSDAQVAFTAAAAQRVQAQLDIFSARAALLAAVGPST